MRILVVEDDENKRKQVLSFLSERFTNADVLEAKAYQSGLKAVLGSHPDIIILDMSMRTFDVSPDEPGGRPQPYAGRELLRQMIRRNVITPVVVLTQYDKFGQGIDALTLEELNNQLQSAFRDIYLGAVYYDPTADGWQQRLYDAIERGQEHAKRDDACAS